MRLPLQIVLISFFSSFLRLILQLPSAMSTKNYFTKYSKLHNSVTTLVQSRQLTHVFMRAIIQFCHVRQGWFCVSSHFWKCKPNIIMMNRVLSFILFCCLVQVAKAQSPTACDNAIPITCASVTTNSTSGTSLLDVTTCGFSTPGGESVYSFTAPITGAYTLNITAVPVSGFLDYFFKDASLGCDPTGWTCIDDNSGVGTDQFTLTGGVTYFILVDDENITATTHLEYYTTCLNGAEQ